MKNLFINSNFETLEKVHLKKIKGGTIDPEPAQQRLGGLASDALGAGVSGAGGNTTTPAAQR